jgi:hypothetical protein
VRGAFTKPTYSCPHCGFAIGDRLSDDEVFTCSTCGRRYTVAMDFESGKAAFFEQTTRQIPEPLWIPKGSIRALVALAMAISCWYLILTGQPVPGYLFGLLLTSIGYYFGFRIKLEAAQSRILDPAAEVKEPLFLPAGCIRGLLIIGFGTCGILLYLQNGFANPAYLEFFIILSGLIVGYGFRKVLFRGDPSDLLIALNHLKGLVALVTAGYLMYLFVGGGYATASTARVMVPSCILSFYYGSRS